MKILFISGSPRNGNTEYLLTSLFTNYEGDKELILLREKNIENCLGCLNCQTIHNCFISDDMSSIIRSMESTDMIVFGIPNYFDNVTGIAKNFMDRCHIFYGNQNLKGKKIYYIFVGGGKIEGTGEKMLNAVYGFDKYLNLINIGNSSYKALNNNDLKNENIDIDLLLKNIIGE